MSGQPEHVARSQRASMWRSLHSVLPHLPRRTLAEIEADDYDGSVSVSQWLARDSREPDSSQGGRSVERTHSPSASREASLVRELYQVSQQIAVTSNEIIVSAAPKIIIAGAALAERLKREPQSIHGLSPRQFELLVAELLEDLGYRVEITRATRDGGKDLLAYLVTELGTLLCLVEAKKYRRDRKVGVELVRSLYGALNDADANQAMLITTSSFSKDAKEFQHRHKYRIALRDYADLARWIAQYKTRPT
ncbi:MAG: restriction endonuclease [Steroidobacteraceae bacterium]